MQLVALAYGAAALFQGRPVFLAALGSRFEVVHADEVSERWLSESGVALPYFGPQWVGTRYPVDPVEVDRVELASSLGVSLGSFPQHHQPLAAMTAEILQGASPVATLQKVNPGKAALIRAWLVSHGRTEADTVFQGLKARSEDLTVMIDKKTGDVIGIAPFKPWE
ncbi:MAG: hypothetical protein JNL19_16150 [Burkholderiales bacterium]|nr:hypothetical protein [Burkholderiales bacterium]